MKKCRGCGVELAIEEFPDQGRGGRKSLCPKCYREHERDRYQERRRRYQREGYDIPDEKECTQCGRILPIDNFWVHKGKRDKHNSVCVDCSSEYQKKYHQKNREEILAYQRQWHRENDPGNKWAIERRKRRNDSEGEYNLVDIFRQWHHQNGRCFWCGDRCGSKPAHHKEYHVDHLIPVANGGTDYPRNLVIACPGCNISKSNKLPIEYKRYRLKYQDADRTYAFGTEINL